MKVNAIAILLSCTASAGLVVVYEKVARVEHRLEVQRIQSRRVVVTERQTEATPSLPDLDELDPRDVDDEPLSRAEIEEMKQAIAKLQARLNRGGKQKPISGIPQLTRMVGLTNSQRARVRELVDIAHERVAEILKAPDHSGRSPWERREALRGQILLAMKTKEWGAVKESWSAPIVRDETIPGRGKTYHQELDRVEQELRREIVAELDLEQREVLGQTSIRRLAIRGGLTPSEVLATEKTKALKKRD